MSTLQDEALKSVNEQQVANNDQWNTVIDLRKKNLKREEQELEREIQTLKETV